MNKWLTIVDLLRRVRRKHELAAGDAAVVGVDVLVGVAVSVQAIASSARAMQVRATEMIFI